MEILLLAVDGVNTDSHLEGYPPVVLRQARGHSLGPTRQLHAAQKQPLRSGTAFQSSSSSSRGYYVRVLHILVCVCVCVLSSRVVSGSSTAPSTLSSSRGNARPIPSLVTSLVFKDAFCSAL
eukprot:GHVU01158373.1.p4 GENE.GHVU01158373.1~~GHVU01158373.1.p4  ORF type:complete len:122 (-),score=17.28 GHVU01158373.1:914-1279(-)